MEHGADWVGQPQLHGIILILLDVVLIVDIEIDGGQPNDNEHDKAEKS